MEDQTEGDRWCVFGSTVQGASHKRKAKPNQDAIRWEPVGGDMANSVQPVESYPQVVLAIADGHGGERYTRAQYGAELAVNCAIDLLSQILVTIKSQDVSHSFLKSEAETRLPRVLVRSWQDAVDSHIAQTPVPEASDNPRRLYGTTLLAAVVTNDFLLCLQLGDGDIRIVTDDGDCYAPISLDERLVGNETYSLALDDAWKYARVYFQLITERPPAVVLLATDGYSNSFASAADFNQVGPDILQMLRTRGIAAVSTELGRWLDEASSLGSGDDVTVGVVCRVASLASAAASEPASVQTADALAQLPIEYSKGGDLIDSDVENLADYVLREESEARQP